MSKSFKLKIIVILFIILLSGLIYFNIKQENTKNISVSSSIDSLFENVNSDTYARITKYIVYGTHLNFEGKIEIPKISKISVSKVSLIMKNSKDEETIVSSNYTYKDNTLSFSSIDNLNEGIYLEDLLPENYYFFIKVTFSNNEEKIYSLSNATQYQDIEYYTMTKDGQNNLINLGFNKFNNIPYFGLKVSEAEFLPDNVYDIVIDPGHGGSDLGAKTKGYNEANIVMDCALILKEKLENLGYKVKLTRDQNMSNTENTLYNMYDSNGRVTIANESHAKLLISLHINGTSSTNSDGGVEVYAPRKL